MRRKILAPLVVFFASAIAAPAFGEPPKADPARAAIERVGKAFADAFARGDMAAVAAMYTEDAIAFPPESEMVKGRAAIEALWKGARDTGVKAFEFDVVDVVSSGNLAEETGTAVLHVQPGGTAGTTVKVKYVVVWKKQKDGSWKLFRDIWNSLPATSAPAPVVTAPPGAEPTPHH